MMIIERYKRFNAGLLVNGVVYLHRSQIHKLNSVTHKRYEKFYESVQRHLAEENSNIVPWHNIDVKFDMLAVYTKLQTMHFYEVDDFDKKLEPTILTKLTVNDKVVFYEDITPTVLLHKWPLVGDDYTGFNIEGAKIRSQAIHKVFKEPFASQEKYSDILDQLTTSMV